MATGLTTKRTAKPTASTYQEWSASTEKAVQRDRVVEFILRNHHRRMPLRFFGLPGERHLAEHQISEELKGYGKFIGVENRWDVMHRALPWLVGTGQRFFQQPMANGAIDGAISSQSRMMFFDLANFIHLGRRDKVCKMEWASIYKKWTCCWLDTCSPVGSRLLDALMNLDQHLHLDVPQVPVAISFLVGRDSGPEIAGMHEEIRDPFERRVRIIETILSSRKYRTFKIVDAWTHEGKGEFTQMGNVVGLMPMRKQP